MTVGEIAVAVGWMALFGVVALAIGRSALGDWREGRRERDGLTLFSALQQWWLVVVVAAVALVVPFVLVTSG